MMPVKSGLWICVADSWRMHTGGMKCMCVCGGGGYIQMGLTDELSFRQVEFEMFVE